MTSRFTPETRGAVLQALYSGLSLSESADQAGLPVQTLKNWLTRGRRETDTDYSAFATAVDEARDVAARAPMSEREFRGYVNRAVRGGSVQAMRLWIALRQADDERNDPFAELDEHGEPDFISRLAARHNERRGALDALDDITDFGNDDRSNHG